SRLGGDRLRAAGALAADRTLLVAALRRRGLRVVGDAVGILPLVDLAAVHGGCSQHAGGGEDQDRKAGHRQAPAGDIGFPRRFQHCPAPCASRTRRKREPVAGRGSRHSVAAAPGSAAAAGATLPGWSIRPQRRHAAAASTCCPTCSPPAACSPVSSRSSPPRRGALVPPASRSSWPPSWTASTGAWRG